MQKLRLHFAPSADAPSPFSSDVILDAVRAIATPIEIVADAGGNLGAARQGTAPAELPRIGILPPLLPQRLGDRSFRETHGTRYAYVAGEMATGIATTDLVVAIG